jgi:NitT/TauT family transport system substrate-binding protein
MRPRDEAEASCKLKLALLLTCLTLVGCSGGGSKIRIAVFRGEELVPLAKSLGHFEKEGLDAEVNELASSSKAMEALLGGSVDAVAGGYDHAIRLASERRETQSFMVLSVRSPLALVASPKNARIRAIGDLKGATVGVSAFGSSGNYFVNLLLSRNKLAQSDVNLIATGGGHAVTVAWAEQGRVDAIVTLPASLAILRTRHPEMVVLANGSTPEGSQAIFGVDAYPAISLMAQGAWLGQNETAARALTRAMLRTLRWVGEHSVEEFQMQLRGRSGQSEELEGLRATIATRSLDGRMPKGGPEAVRDLVAASAPQVRTVDVASTYTDRYLQ